MPEILKEAIDYYRDELRVAGWIVLKTTFTLGVIAFGIGYLILRLLKIG